MDNTLTYQPLREIRLRGGVSVTRMAQVVGKSLPWCRNVELGIGSVSRDDAERLAQFFGTTPEDLFEEDQIRNEKKVA